MKKKSKTHKTGTKTEVREDSVYKIDKNFPQSIKYRNTHSSLKSREKQWIDTNSSTSSDSEEQINRNELSPIKPQKVKLDGSHRPKMIEKRHLQKSPAVSKRKHTPQSYKGKPPEEMERTNISTSDTSESEEGSMGSDTSEDEVDMEEHADSDCSGMESDQADNKESDMESDSEQSDKQGEIEEDSDLKDNTKKVDSGQRDSEGDEAETEDQEMLEIKKELSSMPFEELQKLKEKLGLKAFNQAMSKKSRTSSTQKQFKRENKNRPREMSSKKPVSRFRPVFEMKKKVYRDPRFDDLSGTYDEKLFHQSYSFLDDVKQKEKLQLEKKLKKERDPERKAELQYLIKRMSQQEKAAQEKLSRKELDKEHKKKEREMVKQGKTPFYLKSSEKKKLELADKYRELKKSGKVEKYLMKKRKKNATKERKHLPNQHKIFND